MSPLSYFIRHSVVARSFDARETRALSSAEEARRKSDDIRRDTLVLINVKLRNYGQPKVKYTIKNYYFRSGSRSNWKMRLRQPFSVCLPCNTSFSFTSLHKRQTLRCPKTALLLRTRHVRKDDPNRREESRFFAAISKRRFSVYSHPSKRRRRQRS